MHSSVPNSTNRLRFQRLTLADAPFLLELLNSPGWLKYIGDRGVHNLADAERYLQDRILPAYQEKGCGPMLVIHKKDNTILGNVGVYKRPGLTLPDFGFAFLPEYHGQGYAYEASVAALAYAQQTGHQELLAITLPHNLPSLGLLKKLGFKQEGEVQIPNDPETLLLLRWKSAT